VNSLIKTAGMRALVRIL